MTRKKPPPARVRHAFLYELINGDGTTKKRKAWAIVFPAPKEVVLTLTADHLHKSIALHGAGTTSACAVAICSYDHQHVFPHKVEGHIDFNYSRAFVVSKTDRHTGLPTECYVYEHGASAIARLNDTFGGNKKLLARIDRNGPITVTLRPLRVRSEIGRKGSHVSKSGVRDPMRLRGAKLRYAYYKLGAVPK